jgi:carbonic anhydrase/acetyltransferase-like protein (isoleucine patch superfamily)
VLGESSNLQDGCVIHADPGYPALIGARVTIGHRAVIHGATIEDDVLIGMGAIIMNGAVVRSGSIVAAGAVVAQGVEVPAGTLIAGVPGKVLRSATEKDAAYIAHGYDVYLRLAKEHRDANGGAPR